MTDHTNKLYYLKRAKPVVRDSALMSDTTFTHPLVERTARAISNWQSESDWPLHVDEAIRSIEVVAEFLSREGYRDAQEYLQSVLWREPKHRVAPATEEATRLFS